MNKLCLITVLVCAVVLVMGLAVHQLIVAQGAGNECDLKKIEKAYWCESCWKALEKDDIVEGYICPICDSQSYKAGKCSDCDVDRVKAKWCIDCEKVFSEVKVDVCVKTGYVCEDCGTESFKPGECPDCEEELEKLRSNLVLYTNAPVVDTPNTSRANAKKTKNQSVMGNLWSRPASIPARFPILRNKLKRGSSIY